MGTAEEADGQETEDIRNNEQRERKGAGRELAAFGDCGIESGRCI
jgi:hypothetical protein